jgi:PII-like signaling protein
MLQLRFHFGGRDRCGEGPLEAAVMERCARRGVRAAALLRGVEGFGGKHRVRTDRLLSLSEDAPLVVVAVGGAAEIEALADEVRDMAGEGLVVVERVDVVGHGTAGPATTSAAMAAGPAVGAPGDGEEVVKATVWGPRTGASSPHLEAVAAMKRHGALAATVLLGVDGVLDGERRRARFVAGNRDVPGMTVAIGARTAIDAAVAEVDGAAHLVTVDGVETYRRIGTVSLHSDEGVERNSGIDRVSLHTPPARRVTLVTSEIATGGSHPRYVDLIHALRREGAAGATALRGVWGFRGDGEPHGDRVLALRRDVPMVVEAVDVPERAARWLEEAGSAAGEEDVVYSQEIQRILTLE